MILPVEKHVDGRQVPQVPTPPRVELLIQPLRHATAGALAQAAGAERLLIQRAYVPGRQSANIHPAHQTLEFSRARAQAIYHSRPKGLVGPAQLRQRELQRAGPVCTCFGS
jgi:hypothetical protein